MRELFPPAVAVAETSVDKSFSVLGSEADDIRRFTPTRRLEYVTVRHCARIALDDLGFPPQPIPKGNNGAPVWPKGVVGSLTHCTGYRCAAVALQKDVLAIGIDAEPNVKLDPEVIPTIASERETRHLRQLSSASPGIAWSTALFSAKESVFKAWSPITNEWLGFLDVQIQLDPRARTFEADLGLRHLQQNGRSTAKLQGSFALYNNRIHTAVIWPR